MQSKEKRIEKVSNTFCLSKWLNLSLHLDRGSGHSCYHNSEKKIPIDNILIEPNLLHNTIETIEDRKMMSKGIRPPNCEFCWRAESAGQISDRIIQSTSDWAFQHIDRISKDLMAPVAPTYLEVSFSNTCQMKCCYCGPHNSSAWASEISRLGNYTGRSFPKTTSAGDSEIYKKSFWNWWPKLSAEIQVLRITGGEPLLSLETWEIFEKLILCPKPHLHLIINSNLSVEFPIIQRLEKYLIKLQEINAVERITIITSMEAHEKQAEYIRFGLEYSLFWSNLDHLVKNFKTISFSVTATLQVLSVASFVPFLKFFLNYRKKMSAENLTFDPSAIQHPHFLCMEFLPMREKKIFLNQLQDIFSSDCGLNEYELQRINTIANIVKIEKQEDEIRLRQKLFFNFFSKYDKNRNVSFSETFPTMAEYWEEAKAITLL